MASRHSYGKQAQLWQAGTDMASRHSYGKQAQLWQAGTAIWQCLNVTASTAHSHESRLVTAAPLMPAIMADDYITEILSGVTGYSFGALYTA